ncbi:ABC transporter permease [Clostridium botulinum]|uniref:ABC transporter permease n=1 Tax=Clostridium botulinum TaxID=1491 RepID=UPI00016BBB62|nr:ABC transporter permease [Clostridium botulinum]AJD25728.1 ftsX-like permease family protein [Clostridium botulinum CDC_297]AJE11895.1 ftsX-like permease family protein [Clostridium botulinum CDC_1436]APQ98879.1 ftsX-like permease family protein [Clostridium botulinum]APU59227.1 ftsX-like permease family protein [Clostridium botulinum]AUN01976.1 ABC transporter permease [Clostridium botulinum]
MNFREFSTKNVVRNIRAYFAYLLSSTISAALLFSFTMLVLHPNLDVTTFPIYLQKAFNITAIIAYLFLCFFIFYSVSVFIKSRFKEFGILYILGASDKQIKNMIAIENVLISSLSGIFGVILGLVFSKIFLVLSGKLLGYNALLFYFPVKAIIITLLAFVLMGILISIFTTYMIKEDEVLNLLKGTQKPKSEPKTSTISAILCVILLIGGYYFSITSTMNNIAYRIIPVTVVVIIGTYLLFSQLSVFVIKILKKNREFYMNKTRVLWISNLLYRIKDNTRMFFLVTITSAMAFTSIGAVSAFWINKEAEVDKNFPQAFFYASDKKDYEKLDFIEGSLKKEGYNYTKIQGQIKSLVSKKNTMPINIINESTYNIIVESLGQEKIYIKNNESIAGSPLMSNKRDNILVDNMDIKVVAKLEERVIPALYDDIYIVKDDVYDKISGSTSSFCAFNVESYKDTLNICKNYKDKFGENNHNEDYIILMKADILESHKIGYGVIMFLTIFIGIIFFVTTGSFLYNKYYMDVQQDRVKYEQLNKIGITFKEIKKVSTIEIGVLFLFPYIVSVIHSLFALSALKNAFAMDVNIVAFFVMGSFLIIQIIYFFIIRGNYLLDIKKSLMNTI